MPLKITILTLFPEVIEPYLSTSIPKRAKEKGLVEYSIVNIRDFGEGTHQIVDDKPYGGGAGMVFKADIMAKALKESRVESRESRVILTSPSGTPFNQAKAQDLAKLEDIVIICGHYEGFDQRFIDKYVTEEISVGDYVLSGGELPALTITDAVVRLIPGVLNKEESHQNESFSEGLLEYPHYTRPQDFEGQKVPEVLLNGNHAEIDKWRKEKALEKTRKVRPDLIK